MKNYIKRWLGIPVGLDLIHRDALMVESLKNVVSELEQAKQERKIFLLYLANVMSLAKSINENVNKQ